MERGRQDPEQTDRDEAGFAHSPTDPQRRLRDRRPTLRSEPTASNAAGDQGHDEQRTECTDPSQQVADEHYPKGLR